jgi:hypothetical protein
MDELPSFNGTAATPFVAGAVALMITETELNYVGAFKS